MTNPKLIAAILVVSFAAMPSAMASTNGINALIAVSQLKAQNANDAALQGADKQRENIQAKKRKRLTTQTAQTQQETKQPKE